MHRSDAGTGQRFLVLLALSVLTGCGPPPPNHAPVQEPYRGEEPVNPDTTPPPAREPVPGPPSGATGGLPDPSRDAPVSRLAAEAMILAESGAAQDRARLGSILLDEAWLDRLDPPQVAMGIDPGALQLTRVLSSVADKAPELLEPIARSTLYRGSGYRLAALIVASSAAANPGPGLVGLWRDQLDPESDELDTTIRTLASNGSPAAVSLLEGAFASEAFDTGLVISWFRDPVLRHRQDVALLDAVERLLRGRHLDAQRSFSLVEALFEYRPADWYVPTAAPPQPPARADLTEGARGRLRSIADLAQQAGIIDARRRAEIEAELISRVP